MRKILALLPALLALLACGAPTEQLAEQPDFEVTVTPGDDIRDVRFQVSGEQPYDIDWGQHFHAAGYENWTQPWMVALAWGVHTCQGGTLDDFSQFLPTFNTSGLHLQTVPLTPDKPTLTLTPSAIRQHVWDETDSDIPVGQKADLSASRSSSLSVGWSKTTTRDRSFTVNVKAGLGPFETTTDAAYSESVSVGQSQDKSQTHEIGDADGLDVTIPGGKVGIALLMLLEGSLIADVHYGLEATGTLVVPGDTYHGESEGGATYHMAATCQSGHTMGEHIVSAVGNIQILDGGTWAPALRTDVSAPTNVMRISYDYLGEYEDKFITVGDSSPDTVHDAVQAALHTFANPTKVTDDVVGAVGDTDYLDDADSSVKRAKADLAAAARSIDAYVAAAKDNQDLLPASLQAALDRIGQVMHALDLVGADIDEARAEN